MTAWIRLLRKEARNLVTDESPAWWDGFVDTLWSCGGPHDRDNPYDKTREYVPYRQYRAGARAARQLMFAVREPGS